MSTRSRETVSDLRRELERAKDRVAELEATERAIRNGEVDAIVVDGPTGSRIFTLQSPDEPYRILVERMNEGAATVTPEGNILFCNRRLAEMVGLPAQQVLGASLSSMFSEAQQVELPRQLQRALAADIRERAELRTKSGPSRPVQLSLSPIDSNGAGQTICAVISDVSELARVERSLREQAQVFDLAHDAILLRDLDGRITSWNRGAADLYGWSSEEAIGRISYELLLTEFPVPLEQIRNSIATEREWTGDLRQISRSGKPVVVASRWSLFRDDLGNASAILEVNRDITERRKIEVELQEREAEFHALAELAPQLVWMSTPDGLITYFNQRWVDYTGCTLEESCGRGWDKPFHPDDRQPVWDAWNLAVASGTAHHIECRLRASDGTYRWFLNRGEPLLDPTGKVMKWFGTCTDIDDLKRSEAKLEERVQERTAELRAVNKELESFNYAVAHDLRAPLRHIHGFADILAAETKSILDQTSLHHLGMIQESSERMAQLLEDLLSLSRLGRQEVRKRPCSLNELVDEVVTSLNLEVHDRQVEWRITVLPKLECDPILMRQVLINLLSNALKFTRSRTPAIIEVFSTILNGDTVLIIRDNGIGFDMRYVNKLFGLFQRLHSQEEFEGTGVGLAIVQRIMNRHGGRVWAESTLDTGATFYLAFPANQVAEQVSEATTLAVA